MLYLSTARNTGINPLKKRSILTFKYPVDMLKHGGYFNRINTRLKNSISQ